MVIEYEIKDDHMTHRGFFETTGLHCTFYVVSDETSASVYLHNENVGFYFADPDIAEKVYFGFKMVLGGHKMCGIGNVGWIKEVE
jgi:hypothetical protein